MVAILDKVKAWYYGPEKASAMIDVDSLSPMAYNGQQNISPWEYSIHDGGKFSGGFGATQVQVTDYWTLRARSAQLFNDNLYAKGLIRRLITNEINTGLVPDACPEETIIGVPEDSLQQWAEIAETRFGLWGKSPLLCDYKGKDTFGAIQRAARMEALISGDVLVVLKISRRTNLPQVQLISGNKIRTPFTDGAKLRKGHTISHGVELDKRGRQVAFWVVRKNLKYKRIPAFGEKSKRRIAWLVYGTEKRLDDLRGQPLLSVVLQSLKEIDRYRDSTQRKAVINSILAMFVKKTQDKPGTLPLQGGAIKRETATGTDDDGKPRTFNFTSHLPGLVIDELQTGEEPVLKGGEGTDVNFGTFEEAIIQAVAWANEVPPEILRLAFSNNYSASQAAINEFKIYLNKVWSSWGETFCTPIYLEHLISEALIGKVQATSLLSAWRDPAQYDVFAAWVAVDWYGSIKPSTDIVKQGKGSKMLTDEGWSTNTREARGLTGTKFVKNIRQLKRENELKAEAARPLLELEKEFGTDPAKTAVNALEGATYELLDALSELGEPN